MFIAISVKDFKSPSSSNYSIFPPAQKEKALNIFLCPGPILLNHSVTSLATS
ncbi:MAG TPA: hypothetical protein [Caudoviricetes sp.]|nr:MAG TPA: hypothetical protein [Caudoviricetes sp.]